MAGKCAPSAEVQRSTAVGRDPNFIGIAAAVCSAYAGAPDQALDNATLYRKVAEQLSLPLQAFSESKDEGGSHRRGPARTARWVQQTLKFRNLLETAGTRGKWQLTAEGKQKLLRPARGRVLVAFSTRLGIAIMADCRDVYAHLDQPITLCITSPPYLTRYSRSYGKVASNEQDYIDFICAALEGIVRNLRPGGSIVINIGNDVFEEGLPSRSIYAERLVIALYERLGLHKIDDVIWHNPSRAPSPTQWACVNRVQLVATYEHCYWFSPSPQHLLSRNTRVLQPHRAEHLKLLAAGGESKSGSYGDGKHTIRAGRSFSRQTPGRIPRNILSISHTCAYQKAYKAEARRLALPVHGCPFPKRLARFFIDLLCEPGDLMVEPFFGTGSACHAAEEAGVRWVGTDIFAQYLRGSAPGFKPFDGYWLNPELDDALFRHAFI